MSTLSMKAWTASGDWLVDQWMHQSRAGQAFSRRCYHSSSMMMTMMMMMSYD